MMTGIRGRGSGFLVGARAFAGDTLLFGGGFFSGRIFMPESDDPPGFCAGLADDPFFDLLDLFGFFIGYARPASCHLQLRS